MWILFTRSFVLSFFDARSSPPPPHKLYSFCLCYSVLFSSDNIFSPFYVFFFVLICYVRHLFFRLFFIHFSNSIHCGVYIWCDTVCVCVWAGWLDTIKKAMCLRQFLMSRLLTDAIHITIHTSSSFSRYTYNIYTIFVCVCV